MSTITLKKIASTFRDRIASVPNIGSSQNGGTVTPLETGALCEPDHLYILVHGFNSKPSHLKYVAEQMKEKLGKEALILTMNSDFRIVFRMQKIFPPKSNLRCSRQRLH
jgi:hypothetical protein